MQDKALRLFDFNAKRMDVVQRREELERMMPKKKDHTKRGEEEAFMQTCSTLEAAIATRVRKLLAVGPSYMGSGVLARAVEEMVAQQQLMSQVKAFAGRHTN